MTTEQRPFFRTPEQSALSCIRDTVSPTERLRRAPCHLHAILLLSGCRRPRRERIADVRARSAGAGRSRGAGHGGAANPGPAAKKEPPAPAGTEGVHAETGGGVGRTTLLPAPPPWEGRGKLFGISSAAAFKQEGRLLHVLRVCVIRPGEIVHESVR